MGDRPTVTTLPAGGRYDVSTLNTNFTNIRNQFDDMLGTNGVGGSNNSMSNNLDMNGQNVINVGDILNTAGAGFVSSVDYAEEWATKAENVLVSAAAGGNQSTDYSAYHHSQKAEDFSTTASGHATTASGHATTATNVISTIGLKYTFDNSTSMADPGTGEFRLNHGTMSSVSAIAFDATTGDTGNPDMSDYIVTWDDSSSTINGHLIRKKSGTPATLAIFTVGAVTDNTGWLQVALTHVDSNGSWSNADVAYMQFIRTGDKGDTGTTGATGSGEGLEMAFESNTADSDQGTGKVWYNNGTVSSASVVYMDDVDSNSANINSFVDSFDDSGSSIKGRITVKKQAAPENYHMFNVNGSVVSASTYSKIPVAHVVSVGTISDADAVFVSFSRTGDKGDTWSTGAAGSIDDAVAMSIALG